MIDDVILRQEDAKVHLGLRLGKGMASNERNRLIPRCRSMLRHDGNETLVQLPLANGFRQIRGDPRRLGGLGISPPAERSQQHQFNAGPSGSGPYRARQFDAIRRPHIHIQQHQVKWRLPLCLTQSPERFGAVRDERRPHPPLFRHQLQNRPVDGLAVHDENVEAGQEGRSRINRPGTTDLLLQRHRKPEAAPDPHMTRHADRTAHQLDQTFANGEAEPGPAVFSRRRSIGLTERLEQPVAGFLGNTDARIRNRHTNRGLLRRLGLDGHLHDHVALIGKLNGIRGQIHDDLAEAARVAQQVPRHIGVEQTSQIDPLGRGSFRHEIQRFVDREAKVERDRLQFQLSGLDL